MFSRKPKKNKSTDDHTPKTRFPLFYSKGMLLQKLIEYEKPEFFRTHISVNLNSATVKTLEEDKLFFADYAIHLGGLQKELQQKKYILMENLFQLLITPLGIVEQLNVDPTMKEKFPSKMTFSECFFRYFVVGMSISPDNLKTLCDAFKIDITGTPEEMLKTTFDALMIDTFAIFRESAQTISEKFNFLFKLSFKKPQYTLQEGPNIKPVALKWTYIERFCYENNIVTHDPVFSKFIQHFKNENGILAEKYVCITDLLEALDKHVYKNSGNDPFFAENNNVLQKFHSELLNHFSPNNYTIEKK